MKKSKKLSCDCCGKKIENPYEAGYECGYFDGLEEIKDLIMYKFVTAAAREQLRTKKI